MKRFGATVALDGASLEVRPGEIHALVGENGAGKSTLLGIVAGIIEPDAGRMSLGDDEYRPGSATDARASGVALVHQELSLFSHLSVAENIVLGLERHRGGWLDARRNTARAREVLTLLGHPEIESDQPLGSLSIAARQVVEICRAVAANGRVLLLDEPTSSLQRGDVERLFSTVRRLAETGVAIVYISHVLEEVREIASIVTVLRDGRTVSTRAIEDFPEHEMVAAMAGRTLDRFFPSRTRSPREEPLLSVRDLSAPPALLSASFDLHRGEILGVAGLVGSGRSTLLRALFGLVRARGGDIGIASVHGANVGRKPAKRIAAGLGYLSEDRRTEGLALSMSIADNVTLTALERCSRAGWVDARRQEDSANATLAHMGAQVRDVRAPVRTLSGGNQQKAAVARLLHQDARILLLDEPTRGIDVTSKTRIYDAVAAAADEGCAVLVASSSLPELFGLCDRIAVMRRGTLLPARDVKQWTEHTLLEQSLGVAPGC